MTQSAPTAARWARPDVAQRLVVLWAVRAATAAALIVEAFTHADLAVHYDAVGAIPGADVLFPVQAGAAGMAALWILCSARRGAWALALCIAVSGLGTLLSCRYVGTSGISPIRDISEPMWFPEKIAAAVAEATAAALAASGLITRIRAVSALARVEVFLAQLPERDIEKALGILLADPHRRSRPRWRARVERHSTT